MAVVMGETASLYDKKFVVQTQSYGPEARGGASKSELVIGDDEIDYPKVLEPDTFIAMSRAAYLEYIDGLKEDGILVTNTKHKADEIRRELNLNYKLAVVNANRIAREELGIPITNTTMLGALLKAKAIVNPDSLIKSIRVRFGRIAERNVKAFKRALEETELAF